MHILTLSLVALFTLATPVRAEDKPARAAVERGLDFIQKYAVKWKKDRQCATCHHGTFTVWAFAEAKKQGYAVSTDAVTEATKWTKERLKDIDKPCDARPGWSMVNSPALNLAVMAVALPDQSALSAEELKQIAGHLLRHQEVDGSWAWSSAPAKNRPPPFFESDEVATLLGNLALGPQVPADAKVKSEVREAREKAAAWLAKTKPTNTTQAAALRLLVKVRAGEAAKTWQPEIDAFVAPRTGRRLGPTSGRCQ